MSSNLPGPSTTKPLTPHYCGICTLPTEYCEFGTSISKCKTWLEENDKEEYQRIWGDGESLSVLIMEIIIHSARFIYRMIDFWLIGLYNDDS
jgi:hypothetical protein